MNGDDGTGHSARFIDGNGVAGALDEIFGVESTTVRGRCANCGRVAMLAETRVYDRSPGIVMRCSACDAVLLRLVRGPDRAWLDLSGIAVLQIALPG
jgi:Family of unknown function (DUF6510)